MNIIHLYTYLCIHSTACSICIICVLLNSAAVAGKPGRADRVSLSLIVGLEARSLASLVPIVCVCVCAWRVRTFYMHA